MDNVQRPPFSQIIIYAIGQLGWSLAAFGAANLLVYFYMPPESAEGTSFPPFIYQGAILGIATLIGLINFSGRIFDAVTDPIIAAWSDRMQSKRGRRKKLMGIAALPFALLSFLIFYPLFPESGIGNSIWLCVTVIGFYLFLTMYVIPYTALISELGHEPEDRMRISTTISITWALGFLIGSNAYALQSILEQQYDATTAFQIAMALFALLSLLFMLVPVFFLKENKYAYQRPGEINTTRSIREVFSNINFRTFMVSDLLYWLALTFIQLGIGFFVVVLFQFDEAQATTFLGIGFIVSFLFYAPVNWLVKRYGKKTIVRSAFAVFSILFLLLSIMQWLPLPKWPLFYAMAILSAYPLAAFGIIPNAIVADIIYQHEQQSGQQQSAMFYASRNFMMKAGISLANLIFPSLLLLGKSVENPLGLQVAAGLAFIFCIAGWIIFSRYQEV
jgi:GPH family glycoside/pentoside/hexuronide:cation symporter